MNKSMYVVVYQAAMSTKPLWAQVCYSLGDVREVVIQARQGQIGEHVTVFEVDAKDGMPTVRMEMVDDGELTILAHGLGIKDSARQMHLPDLDREAMEELILETAHPEPPTP